MIDFNARIEDALALASDTKVFKFGENVLHLRNYSKQIFQIAKL